MGIIENFYNYAASEGICLSNVTLHVNIVVFSHHHCLTGILRLV